MRTTKRTLLFTLAVLMGLALLPLIGNSRQQPATLIANGFEVQAQQQAQSTLLESTLDLVTPTAECADKDRCDYAWDDCTAQGSTYYASCVILGGTKADCFRQAQAIQDGCMVAWGCPINH